MPNPIKYTTGTETLALKKGNFYIGTGDVGKGPSDTTGFYQGVSPSAGGYVIYMNKSGAPGDLSYHNAANDSELISFTNNLAGQSYTTANECLVYYAGQTDKVVLNRDYEGIVTDGLVLNLDAGFTPSYPKSGTTWSDVSINTNNGTLTNGPTFSTYGGGSISFDGVNDSVIISSNASLAAGTGDFTYNAWVYPLSYSFYAPLFVAATTNGIWIGKNGSNFVLRAYSVADRLSFGTLPPLNTWTNITITRIGTTASLYYNGVLQTTSTTSQDFIQATTCIGSDGPPGNVWSWYNGRIANTSFYKGVGLSASEVLQNYNAQKGRFGL